MTGHYFGNISRKRNEWQHQRLSGWNVAVDICLLPLFSKILVAIHKWPRFGCHPGGEELE